MLYSERKIVCNAIFTTYLAARYAHLRQLFGPANQTQQTLKSIESQFRRILQQWRTDRRIRDAKLSAKDVTLSFQTQIEVMNKIVIDFGTF